MPLQPNPACSPCAPWWLREVLTFPEDGGTPPEECCFLLEDDTGTLLRESLSGCLKPETC